MSSSFVTIKNGNLLAEKMSTKNLLLEYSFGVYTTCRTVRKTHIFEYRDHMKRLQEAHKLRPKKESAQKEVTIDSRMSPFEREEVEKYTLPSIQMAIREMAQHVQRDSDIRLYLVLSPKWEQFVDKEDTQIDDFDFIVRAEELPPLPEGQVSVELKVTGSRENPTVKHANWIRQKEKYTKEMSPRVNEVLLSDEKGHIFEGLSSNFFVMLNEPPCLLTAPTDTVLFGTVATAVKEICEKKGIELKYAFPSISEFSRWNAAFVTSTSRGVLPIGDIDVYDEHEKLKENKKIDSLSCKTLQEIRAAYQQFILEHSVQVIEL